MTPISLKGLPIGAGIPKICVPITGTDVNQVIGQAGEIVSSSADLAEWRLDYFNGLEETAGLIATTNRLTEILGDLPLIITLRDRTQGGKRQISDSDYQQLYTAILRNTNVAAIDLEWQRDATLLGQLIDLAHGQQVRTIISCHNYDQAPTEAEMVDQLTQMSLLCGNLLELAITPTNANDVLGLMNAAHDASQRVEQPIIATAMGPLGTVTRVAGQTFNSALTFATIRSETAPGQLSVDQTRTILDVLAH